MAVECAYHGGWGQGYLVYKGLCVFTWRHTQRKTAPSQVKSTLREEQQLTPSTSPALSPSISPVRRHTSPGLSPPISRGWGKWHRRFRRLALAALASPQLATLASPGLMLPIPPTLPISSCRCWRYLLRCRVVAIEFSRVGSMDIAGVGDINSATLAAIIASAGVGVASALGEASWLFR